MAKRQKKKENEKRKEKWKQEQVTTIAVQTNKVMRGIVSSVLHRKTTTGNSKAICEFSHICPMDTTCDQVSKKCTRSSLLKKIPIHSLKNNYSHLHRKILIISPFVRCTNLAKLLGKLFPKGLTNYSLLHLHVTFLKTILIPWGHSTRNAPSSWTPTVFLAHHTLVQIRVNIPQPLPFLVCSPTASYFLVQTLNSWTYHILYP